MDATHICAVCCIYRNGVQTHFVNTWQLSDIHHASRQMFKSHAVVLTAISTLRVVEVRLTEQDTRHARWNPLVWFPASYMQVLSPLCSASTSTECSSLCTCAVTACPFTLCIWLRVCLHPLHALRQTDGQAQLHDSSVVQESNKQVWYAAARKAVGCIQTQSSVAQLAATQPI